MHQIAALPNETLAFYAQVLGVLNGEPYNRAKPDSALRHFVFGQHGEGMVTYLVLEEQLRVDVLRVVWLP